MCGTVDCCRTDRDDQDSSYNYKSCYSEIQSQAGFSGDGYIVFGKRFHRLLSYLGALCWKLGYRSPPSLAIQYVLLTQKLNESRLQLQNPALISLKPADGIIKHSMIQFYVFLSYFNPCPYASLIMQISAQRKAGKEKKVRRLAVSSFTFPWCLPNHTRSTDYGVDRRLELIRRILKSPPSNWGWLTVHWHISSSTTDSDYSLPDKTDIEITFRTTTRSGLLVSITNSSGRGSVTLEQLYGQVNRNCSHSDVAFPSPLSPLPSPLSPLPSPLPHPQRDLFTRAMGLLQLADTWYMLESKLPTGTSKTKRLHHDKFEFSLFWMSQWAACPPACTMWPLAAKDPLRPASDCYCLAGRNAWK